MLVGQSSDTVDLVHFESGATTVSHRSISRYQVFMNVSIVAK